MTLLLLNVSCLFKLKSLNLSENWDVTLASVALSVSVGVCLHGLSLVGHAGLRDLSGHDSGCVGSI